MLSGLDREFGEKRTPAERLVGKHRITGPHVFACWALYLIRG